MPIDLEYLEDWNLYSRVIREGVLLAKEILLIATANLKDAQVEVGDSYKSIVEVFSLLCKRGVRIRILHSGVPSESYIEKLKKIQFPDNKLFTMRRCPRVHFKMILIDGKEVYTGSANLTGAGLGSKAENRRNFEIGFLTKDPSLIQNLSSLFRVIWEGKMCDGCGRKAVCYVPLEEPNLSKGEVERNKES